MRYRHAMAGAAVLTALSVTACAGPGARGTSGPPARPAAVSPVSGISRPQGSAPYGSRAGALRFASGLLARVRLPTASRPISSPPPPSLRQPVASLLGPGGPAMANTADTAGLWRVPLPVTQTVAFVRSHPPAGTSRSGQGGGDGVDDVGFAPRKVPAWIYQADLNVSIAPDGHRGSVVRTDAQVIWYPPRTAAEQVTGMHAVTITMDTLGASRRTVSRTFTAPRVIARLARILNGLSASPSPEPFSCPAFVFTYSLAFAATRSARPSVIVRLPACTVIGVSADGRAQPPLWDLVNRVGTYTAGLLGVRMPRIVMTPPDRKG